jgi:hypothetical protein
MLQIFTCYSIKFVYSCDPRISSKEALSIFILVLEKCSQNGEGRETSFSKIDFSDCLGIFYHLVFFSDSYYLPCWETFEFLRL